MSSATFVTSVQLSLSESWSLLRQAAVGRLAVAIDGAPDIFPVNHVVDRGTIVFRTAQGTKLSGCSGRPVAFEVDGYDDEQRCAWSAVAKGVAQEIRDFTEVFDALTLPISPMDRAPKPCYVRIEPVTLTGRRFSQDPPEASRS